LAATGDGPGTWAAATDVEWFAGTAAIHAARPAQTKPFGARIRTPNANSGARDSDPHPGPIT